MRAVILCAGKGERLKPLTLKIPKPLISINNKTILEYILLSLPDEIKEVYLVIQKKQEKIFKDFLHNKNISVKVNFVFQPEGKKGTFFALYSARKELKKEERFLVLNGDDIFLKEDLTNLLKIMSPAYGISYKKLSKRYRTCDLDFVNKKILSFRMQKKEEYNKKIPCFSGALTLTKDFFNYKPIFFEDGEAGIPHTIFSRTKNISFFIINHWFQINNQEDIIMAKKYLR